MTDLVLRDERNSMELVADARADAAVQRLSVWAAAASATHEMATRLVQTSFVPEGFRNKPMEATAAMLAGAEIGLSPMAALRSFDVIQGTAAPRANTLRAVVQSMGHEIRLVESTDTRAVVEGRRRGETTWQKSVWPIARAQKLGLTNKANWKNQPQAMLVARATAECARLIASDAILGIGYTAEELFDDVSPDAPAEVKPKRRTAQRQPIDAAAEPEVDEPAVEAVPVSAVPADDQPSGGITPSQSRMMHALFNKAGVGGREERMAYVVQQIGRQVESSNELSKDEASKVIDALNVPDEPEFDDEFPAGEQA